MTNINIAIFLRRQHSSGATWHSPMGPTPVATLQRPATGQSPERLKGTTHDLFELLERVQSSRIDDQRCVLPAYFNQVSPSQNHSFFFFEKEKSALNVFDVLSYVN